MNDENGTPLRGQNLSCGGREQLHWFCSPCIANLWSCPLSPRSHPLCTAPPPREPQAEDLRLHTLRTLIQQNVLNNGAGGDSPNVEWLAVLTNEDPATPPPRHPWRAPTWALPPEGADPRIYVLDHKHYDDVPRGSLPPVGNLPDSREPVTPMNFNNYRTTVVTPNIRLPFAFGSLVGDAEWAMGIVHGAHGGEWGDFFQRSGAMTQGATERLMAAYLTWRRAQQPHVRQCHSGQDDVWRCLAPQLLLLLPENRNHHHPRAPIPRHNSD